VTLLCTVLVTSCGERTQPQTVSIYSEDGSVEAAPLTRPPHDIACKIQYDREEMNHMYALDACLGPSREACWSGCETTCTSCGVACAGDSACEAHCLAERDTCKSHHCVDIHAQCRAELVGNWLSNKCDAVCASFHACQLQCSQSPSESCQSTCDAMATPACNPYHCDALLNAPERKTLDPRWRANDCERVCGRVWRCAENECSKSPGCGEAVKMYLPCVARVSGANACGLTQSQGLCPEP
jgi:hypothetical protein